MKLVGFLPRWAHWPQDAVKRSPQRTTATAAATETPEATNTGGGIISSLLNPPTTQKETTTAQPTTKETPQQTTTQAPATTQKQTTAAQPTTTQQTQAPTTNAPAATTAKPISTAVSLPPGASSVIPSAALPSSYVPEQVPSASSTATSNSNDSGGFGGVRGKEIATGVGVVLGVAGGFLALVLGIYFWRRHKRRQRLERGESTDDLARPPSPPLTRSLTRGPNGPRQPIDDDDDDYLTSMSTQPNMHQLDDYGNNQQVARFSTGPNSYPVDEYGSKQSPTAQVAKFYADDEYDEKSPTGMMSNAPPAIPPPAVTPSNARFWEQDRPMTPSSGTGAPGSGAIPMYSSMNKYANVASNNTGNSMAGTRRSSIYSNPAGGDGRFSFQLYNAPGNAPSFNNGNYITKSPSPGPAANQPPSGYSQQNGFGNHGFV